MGIHQRYLRSAVLFGIGGLTVFSGIRDVHAGSSREVMKVSMDGMTFLPAHLEVKVGDTVIWTNQDLVPHTVTALNHSFDSGSIAPGKKWKFKMLKPGTINYACSFHPTMKADLLVKK